MEVKVSSSLGFQKTNPANFPNLLGKSPVVLCGWLSVTKVWIYQTLVLGRSSLLPIDSVCLLRTYFDTSHHSSATSTRHVTSNLERNVSQSHATREQKLKLLFFFIFISRFSKIWAPTCWRRRSRATTPVSSPTVRPARGSPTPWWEIQWDKAAHIFHIFLSKKTSQWALTGW